MTSRDNQLAGLQKIILNLLDFDSFIDCSKYKGVKEIREELKNKGVEETYTNISKVLKDLHKKGLTKREKRYDGGDYSFYYYARKLSD